MTKLSTFRSLVNGLCSVFRAPALSALLILAAIAVPNRASAGQFAFTTISPSNSTASVGNPFSVDINFAVGSLSAYGIEAFLVFDPTLLQITSVTNGGSSPYGTVDTNIVNNIAGTLDFKATGGTVVNTSPFTVFSVGFNPIGPGLTNIGFSNVHEYLTGFGAYGVGGGASGGTVMITGSAPSVPDSSSTIALLGFSFVGLAALRRRFVRT